MPKQPTFLGHREVVKKKVTRRELFVAEMDAVVPWGRLLWLIGPHCQSPVQRRPFAGAGGQEHYAALRQLGRCGDHRRAWTGSRVATKSARRSNPYPPAKSLWPPRQSLPDPWTKLRVGRSVVGLPGPLAMSAHHRRQDSLNTFKPVRGLVAASWSSG